jgi:formamidopyrimidine-DNA glycosylase
MPELPEVETIKRGLASRLPRKKITQVLVLKPKSFIGNPKTVIGLTIKQLERRAKQLILKLSHEQNLVVHLKMSGQLLYKVKLTPPGKHTRVIIGFNDGSQLFFNDLRIFGWMKILSDEEVTKLKQKLGPEPLEKEFTAAYLSKVLAKSSKAIKLILLDQEKIAGIGNIYANEALYLAKIRPTKPARELTNLEIINLKASIIEVLNKGIKYKGSSAKDEAYLQATGEKGSYQEHFLIYQREGEKCHRCSNLIKRVNLSGRGTFYCPNCQK